MLTHARIKLPSKLASTPAVSAPAPIAPVKAPAAVAPAATKAPAEPNYVPGMKSTLLHPISQKASPADVSLVANTDAAKAQHGAGSFLGRVMPNLSGRTGMGVGSAIGAGLGALMPGKDDEGDERSALGGALRGAAGGAVAGGALGMVGRRGLINPMVRSLQNHPEVGKAVADRAAAQKATGAAIGAGKIDTNRIAQAYNVHPDNVTPEMLAHDKQHQGVLAQNPAAVRNLADVHRGDALTNSFRASMQNLDAPNAHADWLHQNVVSKMSPEQVSGGLAAMHQLAGNTVAPAGTPPVLHGRPADGLGAALNVSGIDKMLPSGPAPVVLPHDAGMQGRHLAAAMANAAQHGFHAQASQALGNGVVVPSHQALASSTAPAVQAQADRAQVAAHPLAGTSVGDRIHVVDPNGNTLGGSDVHVLHNYIPAHGDQPEQIHLRNASQNGTPFALPAGHSISQFRGGPSAPQAEQPKIGRAMPSFLRLSRRG